MVDELGIELIQAYSPQVRARIERLFGALQDWLVKELRRTKARFLEQADRILLDFLARFNARFALQPPEPAYRAWPPQLDPEAVFCFKHPHTVANDNTVALSGHRFQMPTDRHRGNYARCQVKVRQHLEGSVSLGYQGRQLVCFLSCRKRPVSGGQVHPPQTTSEAAIAAADTAAKAAQTDGKTTVEATPRSSLAKTLDNRREGARKSGVTNSLND